MAPCVGVVSLLTEVGSASGRAGAVAVVHRGELAAAARHEVGPAGLLEVFVGAIDLCKQRCQRQPVMSW